MAPKRLILFKVLLNCFHPGANEVVLKGLPQEEIKEILKLPVSAEDPAAVLFWPNQLITSTHYSWLAPVFQQIPKSLHAPIVASLAEHQAEKLKPLLNIDKLPVGLTPQIKAFLLDRFFSKWQPQEVLPVAYMPPTPLAGLLKYSKEQLLELIDFLALYDLADAIRHIVDKKNLTNIYYFLTPKKQQFLRMCLHKKEKITSPKLDIAKWDGKAESLYQVLHKRGLLRFGKALCGQHPNFLWHIVHILDTGRGTVVSQHYHEEAIAKITPMLIQQTTSLINFLTAKSDA